MSVATRLMVMVALFFAAGVAGAQEKYAVKRIKKEAPKELAADIQKLLSNEAIEFLGKDGKAIAEIWFVKDIQTGGKVKKDKKNLDYTDLPPSTVLGAIRFLKPSSDYRKQDIKPGVYTMRFGVQPQDGDHMGTAPYPNFVLLISPKFDTKPAPLDYKGLVERSAASIGRTHPAVFLLFPGDKAGAEPKLISEPNNTMVLTTRENVTIDGQNASSTIGIALTLVGHSAAE